MVCNLSSIFTMGVPRVSVMSAEFKVYIVVFLYRSLV